MPVGKSGCRPRNATHAWVPLPYPEASCPCCLRRYSIGAVPRLVAPVAPVRFRVVALLSRLAQLVERKTLNLVVVGSSPTVGVTNF